MKPTVDLKKILIALIAWRGLLFLTGALFIAFLPGAAGYPLPDGGAYTGLRWIDAWANWDGGHYLNIAQNSYNQDLLPLFPALPLLLKVVGFALGGELVLAGILVNLVLMAGALYFLIKLFQKDFAETSNWWMVAITVLSLPAAFIFGAVYTEVLFLFLTAALFYCLRAKRYFWLIPLGFFIGITRQPGIVLFPTLLLDLWLDKQHSRAQKRVVSLYLLAAPLGFLGYLTYVNFRFGDFLIFFRETWKWRTGGAPFTVWDSVRYTLRLIEPVGKSYFLSTFELLLFGFYLIITPLIFKTQRFSYALLHLLLIAMPLISNTLFSFPRFLLLSFPAVFLFVRFYNKSRLLWAALVSAFLIGQIWLLYRFILGYWAV